jgi:hypothetical protein
MDATMHIHLARDTSGCVVAAHGGTGRHGWRLKSCTSHPCEDRPDSRVEYDRGRGVGWGGRWMTGPAVRMDDRSNGGLEG